MLLRVTEGCGNLIEYVIARSVEDSFALLGTGLAFSTFSYEIATPFGLAMAM